MTPKKEPKVKSKIHFDFHEKPKVIESSQVQKLTSKKIEKPKKPEPKIDLDEIQKQMDQIAINNQANKDSVSVKNIQEEKKTIEKPKITRNQDLEKDDLSLKLSESLFDYLDQSVRKLNFDDTRKRLGNLIF